MPRSSSVVTATTQHLLRQRNRFVLGSQHTTTQRSATPKPVMAPVR
ncbi:hypothetical protein [Luteipulveratus mongoliensis]|nr:hypothetical protein [Luteipulveratus mongoliensis]